MGLEIRKRRQEKEFRKKKWVRWDGMGWDGDLAKDLNV